MQTSHNEAMSVARAGHVADNDLQLGSISRLAEDSAGAGAGCFVVGGTDPTTQAVAPTTALSITNGFGLGVVRYVAAKMPAITAAAIAAGHEFDTLEMLPVVQTGRIWVLCDDAASITANSAVYVRYASGAGGSDLGRFRQNAGSSEAAELPSAIFRSSHIDVNFNGESQRVALVELRIA